MLLVDSNSRVIREPTVPVAPSLLEPLRPLTHSPFFDEPFVQCCPCFVNDRGHHLLRFLNAFACQCDVYNALNSIKLFPVVDLDDLPLCFAGRHCCILKMGSSSIWSQSRKEERGIQEIQQQIGEDREVNEIFQRFVIGMCHQFHNLAIKRF